jgi:hypothetical protein
MLFVVAPAEATYHLNMVNEVMLASSSGDSGVQFVEFLDHGGSEEVFTPLFAPYQLVVYDAAGNVVGAQTLDANGLRAAAMGDREYLVSTSAADTAFHVAGDERLTTPLPLSAGQACFEGSPPPPAVSCLTWGKITKPVPINTFGTGSANGPVPPNGESDQRQANSSIVAACPTPKAPNTSKPCTTAPRPPFSAMSFATRTVRIGRRGRALVRLRCPAGTNGGCQGTVTLGAVRGSARFGRGQFEIKPSSTASVQVKLSRAALQAVAQHGRLGVLATAMAHDASGTSRTTRARLTIVATRPNFRRAETRF